MRLRVALSLAAAWMTGAAVPVWAQCSMCRKALEVQSASAGDAFNRAILILLLPALALFSGAFLLFVRRDSAK